ncbi:MAG: GntR family transcriptional regulator [Cytophagaceae bacterium]
MRCITKEQKMLLLNIEHKSKTPKYKQIVNSVINDIETGGLVLNDQLPSINELSEEYYLSRDTVEKAYQELKERGIITSIPGKGYFICKTHGLQKINVFLLFNKLSNYKKIIFDAFVNTIGNKGNVDLFIYKNNAERFETLINENLGNYNYFVIISQFDTPPANYNEILERIPKNKLILLDNNQKYFKYQSVYQDFEKNIHNALICLDDKISKYSKLILIRPEIGYPKEIVSGFQNYCSEFQRSFEIKTHINNNEIQEGAAYIILDDTDLVRLLKNVKTKGLRLGKDVGVISYNEDPVKEILCDGITVISTDFSKMGEIAAQMTLNKLKGDWENPFTVISRNSL